MTATGERRLRLLRNVADTLGTSWSDAQKQRYDLAVARSSLAFFRGADIPVVPGPIPALVSDVRFTVDMSGVPSVQPSEVRSSSGLFAAAVPEG
jgi:hypothetical protein